MDPAPRHDPVLCGGWIVAAEDGRPLRKCPECMPAKHSDDAIAIRGLASERAGKPGEWTGEDLVRFTPLSGSPSLGPVLNAMCAEGLIVKVGTRRAQRPSRKGATIAVYIGARWLQTQPEIG